MLRLQGGCIQGTKDFDNCKGAPQQTAPPPPQKKNKKKTHTQNEEDPIGREGASKATASAARYRDTELANDCLDSIDLQM